MAEPIVESLIEQFGRSWQELRSAVMNAPEEQWRRGSHDRYLVPARLAYHILFTADMYSTTMDYESYKPHRKYKLDWEDASVDELPSREQTFTFINETEVTVKTWLLDLGDEGLLADEEDYTWCGERVVDRALYTLRHSQWHIGEINALLRERGYPQVEW